MNLCIDIGNTRSKLAVFDQGILIHKEVWETLSLDALQRLAYNQKVKNAILSSVAEVPKEVEDFLKNNFFYLLLATDTPLPIEIRYQTPQTLGKDRIAAATGAFVLFPSENCLIIDAGTCITTDLLRASGEFLGGNIAPGVEMRLKAMHHFTARLPLVNREPELESRFLKKTNDDTPPAFLGSSTEHAVWNGGMLGAVWELQGFIRRCRQQFSPLRVVLTGGDTDFFAKNLRTKIFAHPNLVLLGLNKILQHNVESFEGF